MKDRRLTFDLAGDGAGSFLSQRRRLARLLGLDEEVPERKPLPEPSETKPRKPLRAKVLKMGER